MNYYKAENKDGREEYPNSGAVIAYDEISDEEVIARRIEIFEDGKVTKCATKGYESQTETTFVEKLQQPEVGEQIGVIKEEFEQFLNIN